MFLSYYSVPLYSGHTVYFLCVFIFSLQLEIGLHIALVTFSHPTISQLALENVVMYCNHLGQSNEKNLWLYLLKKISDNKNEVLIDSAQAKRFA